MKEWSGLRLEPDGSRHYRCAESWCTFQVVALPADTEETLAKHKCPLVGKTSFGWSITVTLVGRMWRLIDEATDEVMRIRGDGSVPSDETVAFLKGKARGYAECLAIFMNPFFTTPDEVVREAVRRHKRRVAREPVVTPGMDELRYMPPPGTANKYTSSLAANPAPPGVTTDAHGATTRPRRRTPPRPAAATLDEAKRVAMANAHSSGFTIKQLASAFMVTEETVREVLGQ